jgi:hypothetical protein
VEKRISLNPRQGEEIAEVASRFALAQIYAQAFKSSTKEEGEGAGGIPRVPRVNIFDALARKVFFEIERPCSRRRFFVRGDITVDIKTTRKRASKCTSCHI